MPERVLDLRPGLMKPATCCALACTGCRSANSPAAQPRPRPGQLRPGSPNSIASQTLDTQTATVAQDKGTVITDQAQVDAQKLNLIYCHIIAPVGGRVGLRQVDPGNYVQTGSATGLSVPVTAGSRAMIVFSAAGTGGGKAIPVYLDASLQAS